MRQKPELPKPDFEKLCRALGQSFIAYWVSFEWPISVTHSKHIRVGLGSIYNYKSSGLASPKFKRLCLAQALKIMAHSTPSSKGELISRRERHGSDDNSFNRTDDRLQMEKNELELFSKDAFLFKSVKSWCKDGKKMKRNFFCFLASWPVFSRRKSHAIGLVVWQPLKILFRSKTG